ncbi:MAG: transcription antitermination factor NusB [Elusimicrobia bacterium]|nr:transcription antitermination factor NusB [Candidatus Liberimonas magnetica]
MDKKNIKSLQIPIKKVGNRRKAREAALKMLYLCDNCKFSIEDAQKSYWEDIATSDSVHTFAKELLVGTLNKIDFLDQLIIKHTKNWKLDRMASIDRNILRLAAFEMIDTPQTPISVIIDEAVEIAKTFSTQDSGKFVNGILDKLKTARKAHDERQPK